MGNLIMFVIVFIFIFLLQYNFFMKPKVNTGKKIKDKKDDKILEIEYLIGKFDLKKENLMNSIIGRHICLINAFIISFVSTVISSISLAYYFQFLIGFILLMCLIYGMYEIYGRYLVRIFNYELKKEEE